MGLEVFERGALPAWLRLRQRVHTERLGDIPGAVAATCARPEVAALWRPGLRVAIGVGSRGIDRLPEVVAALVAEVRRNQGDPFVFPAMGSHGGATDAGQREMLFHLGVTEAVVGAPVRSSMETIRIGEAGGVPVWFDRTAAEGADLIIPVNRVKPHTDFHAPTESGLLKMIAIGMGKQRGADTFHGQGFSEFGRLIPAAAETACARLPIRFGLALVEDGRGNLGRIEAVPAPELRERETALLRLARDWMPRLPGQRIDVLLIDRLGKDISGIGADTNVVHRYYTGTLPGAPQIQRLVVRGLTPATEGNASGIGLADVVLRRAAAAMDPLATYINCITAKTPEGARLPLTVDTDRQAVYVALACCLRTEPERAAIVRIPDTKHLEELWVSAPLAQDLRGDPRWEPLGGPRPIAFDPDGMLVDD